MKYSIIVPVYNAEAFLESCIASVLSQRIDDWELILVNDGSTDETAEILNRFARQDRRIRMIHQENSGQFFTRQQGITAAEGEYLLFLDSDDQLTTDCLEKLALALEKYDPDVLLYRGRIVTDGQETERLVGTVSQTEGELPLQQVKERLLFTNELNSLCLKAFRRELFAGETRDYSAFLGMHCGEDKARVLYPASKAKKVVYIPDVLYRYAYRPNSVMHSCELKTVRRLMAGEMFALLYSFMQEWNMDEPRYREALGVYYLQNYLMAYYNVRKGIQNRKQRSQFRRYPWGEVMDRRALRYCLSSRLSARDKLRLLCAVLRV